MPEVIHRRVVEDILISQAQKALAMASSKDERHRAWLEISTYEELSHLAELGLSEQTRQTLQTLSAKALERYENSWKKDDRIENTYTILKAGQGKTNRPHRLMSKGE